MQILNRIKWFLRLPADPSIDSRVRGNFRQNFIVNMLDNAFWLFGESFVSVHTILPVFASTLTDSPIIIGLVPALIHAGWLMPQLLMASHVSRLPQKMPFARTMAKIERIPYLALPLFAYLLNWIPKQIAIIIFIILVAWRGIAGGMVALPWQEVIATIIPSQVRSRFFGVSRTLGRLMAIIGSGFAGLILASRPYPNNFALSFLLGAFLIWISYWFFSQSIEPVTDNEEKMISRQEDKVNILDMNAFKSVLKHDHKFTKYLISRIAFQFGGMAMGFLAVYGIHQFSLGDEQAAVFSGLLFASGTLGFFIWGLFGDKLGPGYILVISDLLQVISLLIGFLAINVWFIYGLFFLIGFAQSGHIVGDLVYAMSLGGENQRPLYIGMARSIPGIFTLLAPILGGLLVNVIGFRSMFLVATAFTLASGIIILSVQLQNKNMLTI